MHFSYDVELPLGSWDCCKTGPMEPRAELLSPEALLVAMPQHTLSHSPCSLAIPWRLPALCRSAIWLSICIRCLSAFLQFVCWVTKSGFKERECSFSRRVARLHRERSWYVIGCWGAWGRSWRWKPMSKSWRPLGCKFLEGQNDGLWGN